MATPDVPFAGTFPRGTKRRLDVLTPEYPAQTRRRIAQMTEELQTQSQMWPFLLSRATQSINELQARLEASQREAQQLGARGAEVTALQSELQASTEQVSQLQQQLATMSAETRELQSQLQQVIAQMNDLVSQVNTTSQLAGAGMETLSRSIEDYVSKFPDEANNVDSELNRIVEAAQNNITSLPGDDPRRQGLEEFVAKVQNIRGVVARFPQLQPQPPTIPLPSVSLTQPSAMETAPEEGPTPEQIVAETITDARVQVEAGLNLASTQLSNQQWDVVLQTLNSIQPQLQFLETNDAGLQTTQYRNLFDRYNQAAINQTLA